eukprot:Tamp_35599.p3 GENE.Tamp_35599~~Tamp_35599.p3  ORF type:complete len:104 (+),score=4.19 Tamp_35599:197-508(+)
MRGCALCRLWHAKRPCPETDLIVLLQENTSAELGCAKNAAVHICHMLVPPKLRRCKHLPRNGLCESRALRHSRAPAPRTPLPTAPPAPTASRGSRPSTALGLS